MAVDPLVNKSSLSPLHSRANSSNGQVSQTFLGNQQLSLFFCTLWSKEPPPPGGVSSFIMFPHQEPWVRGTPSNNLVHILRGGSSYLRFLTSEHSKYIYIFFFCLFRKPPRRCLCCPEEQSRAPRRSNIASLHADRLHPTGKWTHHGRRHGWRRCDIPAKNTTQITVPRKQNISDNMLAM